MPFMDHLNPVPMQPMYGVPLGGIGCGAIGRGYKGEFGRSSLQPGIVSHQTNRSDQVRFVFVFHLFLNKTVDCSISLPFEL